VLPSLLATVRDNLAHQNYPVTIFEQARVYVLDEQSGAAFARAGAAHDGIGLPASEHEMLTIVLCGPVGREGWTGRPRSSDFYSLKGLVERLLDGLGIEDATFAPSGEPFLHPGKAADLLLGGRPAGYLGQVRPDVVARFGIEGEEVYAADLRVDALLEAAAGVRPYEDLIAFPTSTQDLAVVVDSAVPAKDLLDVVTRAGGRLLRDAAVFDVYEGDQVPAGKRSLAVRLTIRAADRTLTEKEINGVRQKVVGALEHHLGATLR
jgi:phenylalanyl-tRNA synthetase beta chain